MDLPNAKVIWRLRWDEFNLCDEEDYMYERFTVYGLDCSLVFRPMFYFHLDVAGEFEVHAVINGEEFTLTQNKRLYEPQKARQSAWMVSCKSRRQRQSGWPQRSTAVML